MPYKSGLGIAVPILGYIFLPSFSSGYVSQSHKFGLKNYSRSQYNVNMVYQDTQ